MAAIVVEPQAVTTSPDSTFPQQIEVTFTIKLTVNDQVQRDCWFEAGTTNITLDAVADVMDMFCENTLIESVNNLTYEQIQQAFAKREV